MQVTTGIILKHHLCKTLSKERIASIGIIPGIFKKGIIFSKGPEISQGGHGKASFWSVITSVMTIIEIQILICKEIIIRSGQSHV